MAVGKVYNSGNIQQGGANNASSRASAKETTTPKESSLHFRGKWPASQSIVRNTLALTGEKHNAYFKSLSSRGSKLIEQFESGKNGDKKYTYTDLKADLKLMVDKDCVDYGVEVTSFSSTKVASTFPDTSKSTGSDESQENNL